MHYVMDELEVDFLLDAVDFVARYGELFLRLYDFDLYDGCWTKKDDNITLQRFSLESALLSKPDDEAPMSFENRETCYKNYLEEALNLARKLQKQKPSVQHVLAGKLGELQFFVLPDCCFNQESNKTEKGLMGKLKGIFNHR